MRRADAIGVAQAVLEGVDLEALSASEVAQLLVDRMAEAGALGGEALIETRLKAITVGPYDKIIIVFPETLDPDGLAMTRDWLAGLGLELGHRVGIVAGADVVVVSAL